MYLWKWQMFKKYESVIMYNEIINVTNSTTNVTNTLPINSDEEKVRYKILYNHFNCWHY